MHKALCTYVRHFAAVSLVTLASHSANATDCSPAPPNIAVEPPDTQWTETSEVRLVLTNESERVRLAWTSVPGTNDDLFVTVHGDIDGEVQAGELMLVSGRVLATHGLELEPGREIDALDALVLSMRILISVMHYGCVEGPDGVTGFQQLDVRNSQVTLYASTPSGMATYPPPWTLKGSLDRTDVATVTFDLELEAQGLPATRYVGYFRRLDQKIAYPDDLSMSDWTIHRIGPIRRHTSDGEILDFGAEPLQRRFATLGELRNAIDGGELSGR